MGNSEKDKKYSTNSLIRGLEIITLFDDENQSLSLAEIADKLGVSRTTPYRLLYTLEMLGYLRQEEKTKRYELTPKVLNLGFSYLNSMELVEIAQPYLELLRDKFNVSSHLSILDGADVVYIGTATIKGVTAINVNVGLRLKAHAVANGQLLLAHEEEDYLQKHFTKDNLIAFTNQTRTNLKDFEAELKMIKEQEYAISRGEFLPSVNSIAVPIYDRNNKVIAALNVVGTDERLNEEFIIRDALPEMQEIAEMLSYHQKIHN